MRLHRDPEPTPDMRRELAALDAALAGRRVDPEHEEIRALAVALQDERPQPRPEFALELDLSVRDGFRRATEPARPARARPRLRLPARRAPLALATAAALFIVATAVLTSGVLSGGDDAQVASRQAGDGSATSGAARESAPATRAPSTPAPEPSISPPIPGPPADIAPGARRRQVERAAAITLATEPDRIEDVADGVIRVTDRHGGFVLSSSVSSGDRARAGAALELRIPADRLQPAVADLSELGHVRSRTQSTRDITGEFTSPRRRLADALAERRGLLRQLARADTPNETAAARARLRAVNRRIDRAREELRRLRERASFAAVSVAVEPGAPAASDGGWTVGDALDDAVSVLRTLLGVTLVSLAVLVPAALLGAAALLAYRWAVRRRRERALDM